MRRALALLPIVALTAGCLGSLRNPAPARRGAEQVIAALAGGDPRAAYALLSSDARQRVSYQEFALQWKASAPERAWQVARLREAIAADPDVGERAAITFADGKSVALARERQRWTLETPLVSRTRAARPREAVRLFAEAVRSKDLSAVLRSLTQRRRDGLTRQIEGFVAGLDRRVEGTIEEIGSDRAELRWDDSGMRYRIVMRKEDDEWRIDDIHIQIAPKEDDDATTDEVDPGGDIF